jgi:starch-binding outer membrane protein, SusD/RagB family
MKTIYLIFCTLLFAFIAGNAQPYNNTNPRDETEVNSFLFDITPETAAQDLDTIYRYLKLDDWWSSFIISEVASDDCAGGTGTYDDGNFQRYDRGLPLPNPNPNSILWDTYYEGISRANNYLEYEGEIDWTGQENLELQYRAEARFLRAYMHFYLTRFFGKIPALDHTLQPGEEMQNTPVYDLYSFIIDDLKFCVENGLSAPYTGFEENWGRATKWAAEAMLGRVYLFYSGYYNESVIGDLTETDARGYIDEVIQNGGFDLVPEYASLWRVSTFSELGGGTSIAEYAGEINPEVIWSVRLDTAANPDFPFLRMIGPRNTNIDPYGQGWGAMTVLPSLWNAYDSDDKRRTATILSWDDEGLTYDWNTFGQAQYTGYNTKKYDIASVGGMPEAGINWQLDAFEDYMVIRFADVLLMGAEFHLLNGDNSTALEYINRVRQRAFGNGLHNYTSLTLDDIFAERKLELACEGMRYWDILRSCKGDFSKLTSILTYTDEEDGDDFSQTTDVYSKDVDGSNFISFGGLFQKPYEIPDDISTEKADNNCRQWLVYPNPTTDMLKIKVINPEISSSFIQLYDISGKLLVNKQISKNEDILNLSNYTSGMYYLRISEDQNSYSTKVNTYKIFKN